MHIVRSHIKHTTLRYFIQLSFDGTAYHGWQIQPNAPSVQQTLEEALSTLLRKPTDITGAGRTDTGVHAHMMVAHFDCEQSVDTEQLCYKLNRLLPRDIAVQRVYPVSNELHARFSAYSRTYHYHLHTGKQPFLRHYSWQMFQELDIERMNEAAERLLHYEDFTSFSKVNNDQKTNICHITYARWEAVGPEQWRFTITANRFLRNMVRAIVGTLVEVGRHRLTVENFCRVIERKDRCQAGESVPALGLSLVDVKYPTTEEADV